MTRISVVHIPFYSHIGAATRLAAVLARQGHEVRAWGPAGCREQIEASGASFALHRPEMPTTDSFAGFVASLAELVLPLTETLIEELFDYDPDLLVHDSQVPWARVAGDFLGIPRIVTHPMFPLSDPKRIASVDEQLAPLTPPEQASARFEQAWHAVGRRWGVELGTWDSVIHTAFRKGETIVTFTTDEILGPVELSGRWHCVGPLMDPPPTPAARPERPLVYACFGTSFNRRRHQFRAVLDALADEPVAVVVSTGRSPLTIEELGPLPANAEIHEFADNRERLARASVHITHGGCNSVHESLLAGVPMVCLPQAYDQFPLTGRLHELGVARVVSETPQAIRDGVRWALEDPAPARLTRELGQRVLAYDGERRVRELVEQTLAHGAAHEAAAA
ncbi:MAG TPA: glycosyltransferase [Solirubrobacteraceae bacterium]|nr:glycosyltransferase [Solirubrobacteraceae bacterium]